MVGNMFRKQNLCPGNKNVFGLKQKHLVFFWFLQHIFPAWLNWETFASATMFPSQNEETCFRYFFLVLPCCHASMPRGNTKCFCSVAEANFASWKQNWRWKQCFSCGKTGNVRDTGVSGNMFPRFVRKKVLLGTTFPRLLKLQNRFIFLRSRVKPEIHHCAFI